MTKTSQKEAEKKGEEIEKISETENVEIEESKEESVKPAKNKEKKAEVFLNETPRMQKFKQLNNL